MKKILFVTSNLGIGGAQQHLILFANHLYKQGYKILIINTNNNNDFVYRLDIGIELINIPRKFSFDLSPNIEIYKIAVERNFKTVFCDSLFSYLFARKLSTISNSNISVIFHTTNYVDNYNYFKDLVVRMILNRKIKLIAVSQNQINRLSLVLLIPKHRFKLIYNGIDPLHFNYNIRQGLRDTELRKDLGIPSNAFVLIKTARFAVEKNHELAVEVMEILIKKTKINPFIIFVGNTNKARMEMISALAYQKGIADHIKIVGNKEDVRPYLAISDLFILTSKSVETFSIAALEAMGMGLPCVLSDIGGANEMIFNSKNGFVAPFTNAEIFADKIIEVFNGQLSLDNIEISQFIINKFNVENTNSRLEEFVFENFN